MVRVVGRAGDAGMHRRQDEVHQRGRVLGGVAAGLLTLLGGQGECVQQHGAEQGLDKGLREGVGEVGGQLAAADGALDHAFGTVPVHGDDPLMERREGRRLPGDGVDDDAQSDPPGGVEVVLQERDRQGVGVAAQGSGVGRDQGPRVRLDGVGEQMFLGGPTPVQGRLAGPRSAGDPVESESGPPGAGVLGERRRQDPRCEIGVARPPAAPLAFVTLQPPPPPCKRL